MNLKKTYLIVLLSLSVVFTSCNNSDSTQSLESVSQIEEQQETKDSSSTGYKTKEHAEVTRQDDAPGSLEGLWVDEDDSLAFVKINGEHWISGYDNQVVNNYSIEIADKLSQFVDPSVEAEFIILTNQTDTMYYELNGVTKEILSLTWYPGMRLHVYRRKE